MMFTQVYFQKTRRAYDHHATEALRNCIIASNPNAPSPASTLPPPTEASAVREYSEWDDWRALGMIASGHGGHHGDVLRSRLHDRCVFETRDVPTQKDLDEFDAVQAALGPLITFSDDAYSSWYKAGDNDILIVGRKGSQNPVEPLSLLSAVVGALPAVSKKRLYARLSDRDQALRVVDKTLKGRREKK